MIRRLALLLLLTAATVRAQSLAEIRAYVVREEGVRLHAYVDRGAYAIGAGHSTRHPHAPISHAQSERFLTSDLTWAMTAAFRLTPSFECQPKAIRLMIISLVYELGATGYSRFYAFRSAIERRDYRAAANHLHDSLWAKQLPERSARYTLILDSLQHPIL